MILAAALRLTHSTIMRTILLILLLAVVSGFSVPGALAAEPLLAQIKLAKRPSDNYYVLLVDKKGVHCSKNATGNPKTVFPIAQIESLTFRMPVGWEEAMALRQGREYGKAAAAFSGLARQYAAIAPYKDSPSALASYWALDSFRRAGEYKALDKERVKAMARNVSLSEKYQVEMEIFRAWGHVGSKAWRELLLVVNDWELPPPTSAKIPPPLTRPFKALPANLVAQLTFLRGTAHENLNNDVQALVDYARVYTVDLGRELELTRLGMLGALRILKRHPEISFDYRVQKQAHALAVLFNERFQNSLPKEFTSFLTPPVAPEPDVVAAAKAAKPPKE